MGSRSGWCGDATRKALCDRRVHPHIATAAARGLGRGSALASARVRRGCRVGTTRCVGAVAPGLTSRGVILRHERAGCRRRRRVVCGRGAGEPPARRRRSRARQCAHQRDLDVRRACVLLAVRVAIGCARSRRRCRRRRRRCLCKEHAETDAAVAPRGRAARSRRAVASRSAVALRRATCHTSSCDQLDAHALVGRYSPASHARGRAASSPLPLCRRRRRVTITRQFTTAVTIALTRTCACRARARVWAHRHLPPCCSSLMLPLLLSSYLRVSVLERWHVRWSWREVRSRETPNMHTYVLASYMGGRRWSRGSRSDKEVFKIVAAFVRASSRAVFAPTSSVSSSSQSASPPDSGSEFSASA